MAYRTQSTRSQYRDVSPSEEDNSYARDITAAATAFLGGELISLGKRNAERKQINNALMLQSEANRVKLMTDVGKLATIENGVDKTQLKETSSAVIKDFSDAQLRVNRSTGTYVYTDPLTGQEMTREDDLKTISQASDYINTIGSDIEANEALIGKLQEQIAMNNIGNHPGGIDMNTVDPRILSIALGDDPSKGMRFTETYKVTYDKEKGYMTNVVYKGKAIKEANKALGVSGDEFTINTKSLAGILNDPERNPANMYAYLSSNNFVGEDKMFGKQASQLTDPKTGRLRDNFYTNVDSGKAINIGGNRMQIVDRDALKYDEVHSALNGSSVGAVGTTMRGNNPQQVITDIRAYTRYNEETKEYYYHEPVVKNGNLQYNDKGEVDMQDDPTVLVKDGQLMVDQNDLDSKLTEMYTQFQLTEMGAYDKIKTTPIGNPYDASKLTKDPTRKQIAEGTIDDFIRNVELAKKDNAFNPETLDKVRLDNVAELISGVYGGGKAEYDTKNKLFIVDKPVVYDENGNVITKGEKISLEYDPSDPNALNRLRQKLETSLGTTTEETKKGVTIGKSSPEETERDKRNRFESNFPNLRVGDGLNDDMEEEEELVEKLEEKFPTLNYNIPNTFGESITINGVEVSKDKGNYNPKAIMDVIYEQLNKSKAKEPKKEVPEVIQGAKEISIYDI